MTRIPSVAALFGFAALALAHTNAEADAQAKALSDIPSSLQAPAGEKVVLRTHASGSQIYVCAPGTDGKAQWTLKGPQADLHDRKGAVIGHHFAGPTWKHNDGSEVTGKVVAKADSPDPNSIAWLLLTASGHSGDGVFAHVTSVQRIHTRGGQPPPAAECDASKVNTEAKSSYTADYYFYAPAR
jgi:Protein of unknown function (DUF3455)